jgi:UDP-glucose 4-epimerase
MSKVLVTGSKGFIGRNLVRNLKNQDFQIIEIDIFEHSELNENRFSDITRTEVEDFIIRHQPSFIIHCAALVDVRESYINPKEYLRVNSFGTANLINAAKRLKDVNFIYLNSGGATYDPLAPLPLTEISKIKPVSPYGISKQVGEDLLISLNGSHNMNWTSLALSNCFGNVYDHQKGVIFKFWKSITDNSTVNIYGQNITRDFIHLDDVLAAINCAMTKPLNSRVNISSNTEVRLEDLFKIMTKKLQVNVEPKILKPISGEVSQSRLDNSLAFQAWGWEPSKEFDERLDESLRENL